MAFEDIAIGPALRRIVVDPESLQARRNARLGSMASRRRIAAHAESAYLGQEIPLTVPPRAIIGPQPNEVALILIEIASPQAWRLGTAEYRGDSDY